MHVILELIARGLDFLKLTNQRHVDPNVDQSHRWKFPKVFQISESDIMMA